MNMYSLKLYSIIVWVLVKHTELKLPIFSGDFVRALEVGLIVRSSQAQLTEMGKLVKGYRSMRLKQCSISASLHFLIVLIWLYKTGKWERWEFEHARKVSFTQQAVWKTGVSLFYSVTIPLFLRPVVTKVFSSCRGSDL